MTLTQEIRQRVRAARSEHVHAELAARREDLLGARTPGRQRRTHERRGGRKPRTSLTGREREVLRLMAQGFANQAIARKLFVSEETVKSHARHILEFLGARNRTHAVVLALARGDITLDELT
jgi:DNA-binding NarL/FixJ family response regulator